MIWAVTLRISEPLQEPAFWLPVLVLYVDDWLTSDDDRWRRFKDGVRNRVKWLMELPVLEPIGGTT